MSEAVRGRAVLRRVTAYALFGGADFGSGFWDLIAGGAERGERPRAVVSHSIGPVWEANHVWLIFILVVMWTAFSEAFASIMLTLFVPLSLAALGIVLRGSSFAFRKEVSRVSSQRNFGAAFASRRCWCRSASARWPARSRRAASRPAAIAGDPWSSWINPTSILGGVLAVVVCAYLAAVYLVWDADRFGDAGHGGVLPPAGGGRRRSSPASSRSRGSSCSAPTPSTCSTTSLTGRALPLVILSALCGIGSLVLLLAAEPPRRARARHGRGRRR